MKDYDQLIARLKRQIAETTERLERLEAERIACEKQRLERKRYVSSREILDLLASRSGRTGSMASIKRWADDGLLGTVIDEREAFPLLSGKQGNKRFLYPRRDVLRFLHGRGLLVPSFDVLDRVRLERSGQSVCAVITAVAVSKADTEDELFVYQAQLEESGEVIDDIPESALQQSSHDSHLLAQS
ncbi:hypothetical protein [Brevibacillus borstelensis]|uniref:hypothetical protein n=1 Tax=Brevibacillus borstelensis TaxID=45462 RepID=UPI0030BD45F0